MPWSGFSAIGTAIAGDRLRALAAVTQGIAVVQVGVRRFSERRKRPLDELQRSLDVPALIGEHAEQMQCVGMVGVGRQDLRYSVSARSSRPPDDAPARCATFADSPAARRWSGFAAGCHLWAVAHSDIATRSPDLRRHSNPAAADVAHSSTSAQQNV